MASILQTVISKGIYSLKVRVVMQHFLFDFLSYSLQSPDAVSKIKTVANNILLYGGLIGYTAIGAKVTSQ